MTTIPVTSACWNIDPTTGGHCTVSASEPHTDHYWYNQRTETGHTWTNQESVVDVSKLLSDTEEHHVDYEWTRQGEQMVFTRTVWTKRYRKTDREIVHEEVIAVIALPLVPGMVQDIVQELTMGLAR